MTADNILLLGELLGLCLAIWIATYVLNWLWRIWLKLLGILTNIWEAVKAWWRRLRNRISEQFRQLRQDLEPLTRSIPRIIVYCISVLALSVAAPWLFLAFGRTLGDIRPDLLHDAAANTLVAAVAGFSVALLTSALRGRRIVLAENMLRALAGTAMPDRGWTVDVVPFVPRDRHWDEHTVTTHFHIAGRSSKAPEWIIALNQAGGLYRGTYALEFLGSQITALENRLQEIRLDRSNEARYTGFERPPPVVQWVCFVSRTGRFHAMQRYDTFKRQITHERNPAYLDILNADSETAFAREIQEHMRRSTLQTGTVEPSCCSAFIPGLECFWIENGTTRETALRLLAAADRPRAMLVRERPDGGPLGVVTVEGLTRAIVFRALDDARLAGAPPRAGEDHAAPPWYTPRVPATLP
jgi:hypothetical protein